MKTIDVLTLVFVAAGSGALLGYLYGWWRGFQLREQVHYEAEQARRKALRALRKE